MNTKVFIRKLLREGLSVDKDFTYKGYDCKIPYLEHRNAYGCSVYKNGKYIMGIKGWLSLDDAKQTAINYINRQLSLDESVKLVSKSNKGKRFPNSKINESNELKTNRGHIIDNGDKIIKLTNDSIEYENALRLIRKPNENFIKYYSAEPYKEIDGKPYYKLIMEKIKPLSDELWDAIDLIQQSLGSQDYMLNDQKRHSFLMELKRNPDWYEDYGNFNKMMSLISSLVKMYKYAKDNGFVLYDLRAQNLGITDSGKLVHFDLGAG